MDDRKKTERVYLHPVDPQFKQLLGGKERKGQCLLYLYPGDLQVGLGDCQIYGNKYLH